MYKKLRKNDSVIFNQLRTKLLFKNIYEYKSFQFVRLSINLNHLKSFQDDAILEALFLIELLSGLKGSITFYKKMFQEVNLQIAVIIRKYNILYFLFVLKVFYFPLIVRRNEPLIYNFDKDYNFALTLNNSNILPNIPDLFFKWSFPVNCFFFSNFKQQDFSLLYLSYLYFPIYNLNEIEEEFDN